MKKILLVSLIGFSMLVASCGKKEAKTESNTTTTTTTETTTASGDSVKTNQ